MHLLKIMAESSGEGIIAALPHVIILKVMHREECRAVILYVHTVPGSKSHRLNGTSFFIEVSGIVLKDSCTAIYWPKMGKCSECFAMITSAPSSLH